MANQYSGTLQERFELKYMPEPNSGCWLWTGCMDAGGYGRMPALNENFAHRVSWKLSGREIASGHKILHRCDTPACVNPDHLFHGTQLDNVRDCKSKGRLVLPARLFGEDNPVAALTCLQVKEIRRLAATCTMSQNAIARMFDVSPMTISRIIRRKIWKTV